MNAILDPLLDRSNIPSQNTHPSTVAFQGLINDFSLTDLFRAINPSARQYSFYSDRHTVKATQELITYWLLLLHFLKFTQL